jgi:predicted nuclease of predicted toxin-antitoxin system
MIIWVDAHLSPAIATWITNTLGITAVALRDLGLRDAEDLEIFEAAKTQKVIFMTKDSDFVDLVDRLKAPPQIIWLTCGNTSNARLKEILSATYYKHSNFCEQGKC